MGSTYVQTYEGTHARRIARAATHPGPASPPPFSHIRYVLHQIFHLLSARLNTLIVMLTFTCQVWAFKYIFGSVLVFHTFSYCVIFLTAFNTGQGGLFVEGVSSNFFCQLPHMPGGSHPCLLGLQSVVDLTTRHLAIICNLAQDYQISILLNSTHTRLYCISGLISTVAQGKPTP